MRALFGVGLVVLAGCGAPQPVADFGLDPIPFTLDPRGIQLLDRAQRVDFGRTDHSSVVAMNKLTASAPEREGGCAEGGRYAAYPGGIVLHFAAGDFLGWSRQESSGTIQQAGRVCSQI